MGFKNLRPASISAARVPRAGGSGTSLATRSRDLDDSMKVGSSRAWQAQDAWACLCQPTGGSMKATKVPVLWLLLATIGAPLTGGLLAGCEEGPLEEAGEEIDDAVDDVEDEIDRRN